MLPKKTRHILYAALLLTLSVVCTSAVASTKVYNFITETVTRVETSVSSTVSRYTTTSNNEQLKRKDNPSGSTNAPMFMTIVDGIDDTDICTNSGGTTALVFVCGDYDLKPLTLQGSPAGAVWERYVPSGSCSLDFDDGCPSFLVAGSNCSNGPSDWTQVGTGPTYTIDPADVPLASGTEYRVTAGGQTYYIKATKSTFDHQFDPPKNVVCGQLGSIRITELSPAYELRIDSGSGFGPWQDSKEFTNLPVGTYTVEARLRGVANACEYPYPPFTITEENIDITVTVTDATCPGQNGDIRVDVNGAEVPGPYTYTLIDAATNQPITFTPAIAPAFYNFNSVSPGTYIVQVETPECQEDFANGISAPRQDVDVNGDPIVIGVGLQTIVPDANLNGQSFGCADITNIGIDITTVGGTPPYTYTVTGGGSGTSPAPYTDTETSVYNVTASGNYTFTFTDANGCSPDEPLTVFIADLPPPTITATDIHGTCTNGGGKVEFVIGNNPGYNLEYRLGPASPWVTTSIIPTADGVYNQLEVRYSQGAFECEILVNSVTVTSDSTINGSASITLPYTCTAGATIEFDPALTSGGSGTGYEYSIDNITYQSGTVFAGLSPGTYTPYVRDDADCRQPLPPLTVTDSPAPTNITFSQGSIDCATGTSEVTVNVAGGVPTFTYEIVFPASAVTAPQGSPVFPNLALDTRHDFVITDANGCDHPASFVTGGVSTIRARIKSGGDTNVCEGASDGFGTFIIDGFATDYDYIITATPISTGVPSTFASGTISDLEIPITGLEAGDYEISVTDNDTNCVATTTIVVSGPPAPLTVTANFTQMSCANGNVGSVEAIMGGGFSGQAQYRLTWPGGATIQGWKNGRFFGGLSLEGEYILEVRDSEGCIAENRFTLASLDAPAITLDSANYCYAPAPANTAAITVSSTVGTGNINDHQYRINGQPLQTTGTPGTYTFTDLVPGSYVVEVVNVVTNCSAQLPVEVIPSQLQVELNLVGDIACGGDGSLRIIVSGGDISDLTSTNYTLYKDGTPVPGRTNVALTVNPDTYVVPFGEHGDYTIDFTDNNGCTDTSEPLTLIEPTNITATHQATGPSCGDPNSGFVEIIPIVTPGVPPFQYVFGPAGSLTDVVTDPNYPDGDALDGIVYTFSSQNIYSGLAAGNYEYIVIDDRGCPTSVQAVVVTANTDPAPVANVSPINATCTTGGPASGGVTINSISPGSPNYSVQIEDNFGTILFRQDNVAPGDLPFVVTDPAFVPGNYQVVIIDSRGCTDIQPVTIGTASLDIIPNYPTPPPTCTPGGTTVCIDIVGGTLPEDYSVRLVQDPTAPWEEPNTDFNTHCFTGLLWGVSYTVEVMDDNTGCTYEEVITLPDGPGVTVSIDVDGATCRNGDVGVGYTITAGTSPFNVVITNLDTGTIVSTATVNGPLPYSEPLITVSSGRYGIAVVDANDCSGGSEGEAILNAPRVDIISNQNANCNALGQLTVRGSGGTPYPTGSPYLYAYVPAGDPIDDDGTLTPGDSSDDFTDATTVSLAGSLAPGTPYDIWVKDFNDCAYRISAAVIQEDPPLPAPTITVNNQCDVSTPVGGFEITVTMPGNIDTPTFTLNGDSFTPAYTPGVPTQQIFYVNSIGNYPVNVTDVNGCFVDDSADVYQVLSASGGFSTDPNCLDATGVITVTADGGSGDFTFDLQDPLAPTPSLATNNTGVFPGLTWGNYQVLVTDNLVDDGVAQCQYLVSDIIAEEPEQPVIIDTGETDISCAGDNDGSITLILQPGSDSDGIREYNLYSGTLPSALLTTPIATDPTNSSFTNLAPGTYVAQVVTEKGCTDEEEITIDDPEPLAITATNTEFSCQPGTNQAGSAFITAALVPNNGGTGPVLYRIDPADSYQTNPVFEIVDNGTQQIITVEAIDANGCTATILTPITLNPPSEVSGAIAQVTPMSCIQGEMINVEVNMVVPADYVIRANSNSVATFTDISRSAPTINPDIVPITLPQVAGDYYLEIVTGGCVYPIAPYTVTLPIDPTIVIAEVSPETCFNAGDGVISLTISDYTGNIYTYWVYDANDPGFTSGDFTASTPVTGASGQVTGTIDITTDGNPVSIAGIPGGNVRVVVREDDLPNCNGISNVITVRSPNPAGPLEVINLQQDQTVGCSNDLGILSFNSQYGWDTDPVEFQVEYRVVSTDPWTIVQPFGLQQSISNRPAGFYRITARDIYDCTGTQEIELIAEPPVAVALTVERQLECPNGTDAILVAVDPNDATIEGAIGGVPGENFIYQLIKLDSNNPDPLNMDPSDPANHEFLFGQQASPRFEGSGGIGVIPAGFYSVYAASTYGCEEYSAVIEVIPPPVINPSLRLVSAPACGDVGILELKVFDFEPGATYEYRVLGSSDLWVVMTDQGGTAVENIPGTVNVSYEFEVRKNGANGPCLERFTNEIRVETPLNLSIDSASPQNPPSCSTIEDGRIEIFASGGTGIYEYSLYNATAADPDTPTTIFRNVQSSPNFENLPAGYFVAVVTSGDPALCRETASFNLVPAIEALITATPQNILCFGEETGSITLTVDPSYSGLVKFAIEPNFSDLKTDPDNPLEYTFTDLPAGTYRILAQDAANCPYFFDRTILEPTAVLVGTPEVANETCLGDNDGMVVIPISGGTPLTDTGGVDYYEMKIERTFPVDERSDTTPFFDYYDGQVLPNDPADPFITEDEYFVTVRDSNGCEEFTVFRIEEGVLLDYVFNPVYGCSGDAPYNSLVLEMIDLDIVTELSFYLEDINNLDPTVEVLPEADRNTRRRELAGADTTWNNLAAGSYQAYIFHTNGCSQLTEVVDLEVYERLQVSLEPSGVNTVTATAQGGFGAYEYIFQGVSQGADNVFVTNADALVEVRVVDELGCEATASIPFTFTGMLEIPNFFTPDGDGENDEWVIRNREFFPNITVKIYDRYGRVVARLDQLTNWDGTYDGNEVPSGDYWFVVNQNDDKNTQFLGHFTLYR